MRKLTRQELKEILEDHLKWLNNGCGTRADLHDADLHDADLCSANLCGANLNERTSFFAVQCPEEGSFIAWKKCYGDTIVKLLIPENAKRSSATTRKCRSDKAFVLNIFDSEGNEIEKTVSNFDNSFEYIKNKEVLVEDYDENRWKECSTGIHFFITRREAECY